MTHLADDESPTTVADDESLAIRPLMGDPYTLWGFYDLGCTVSLSMLDKSRFIDSWLYSRLAFEEESLADQGSDIDETFSNLSRVPHMNAAVSAQAKKPHGARRLSLKTTGGRR